MNSARGDLSTVVYTPESELRAPGLLLQRMWQDFKGSCDLAWRFFLTDLSIAYRRSLLGILWSFLIPLSTAGVFVILHSEEILNIGETAVPFPVFALVGVMLWQIFLESLNAPLDATTKTASLFAKVNFPREAVMVSAFYGVLFGAFIKSIVLLGILHLFHVRFAGSLLFVPLAILMLILLGMAFGLFLASLGMFYSDVSSAMNIIKPLWFLLTPVVYPPPKSFPYSLTMTLNPVSPLLNGARDLITQGDLASAFPCLIISGFAFVGLLAGWILYRLAVPIIVERRGF